ncbi:hypothetical protein [Candidatus Williamhamiltonella defendens]|nr:hypothetical protein [Candidatus Hamiltonella defensa]
MNRAVRALFQNGQFSLKDCRALYTEVTYEDHLKEGEAHQRIVTGFLATH